MDLGATIKDIRGKLGLTQEVFANNCGITQTYLSQIENNLKEPHLSTLKKIAEQLKLPLPILFFLSLTIDDVSSKKRNAFKSLNSSVKSLINEFFTV